MPTAIKILIAGGFGAGKTTMVTAVSETRPLRTEEILTQIGQHIDDLAGIEGKPTTTVAFDFGRITISGDYMLYLFGTPGQERFWFVWDDLNMGALGAVVLADTRRLADCFPAIDYFEQRDTPFVVALNCFDGAREFTVGEVRQALNLEPEIPIVMTDARRRDSGREVLITLVEHAMRRGATPVGTMS
ncbi:signal recognition particle receptor subunit beta [Nonomuraea roseoviolacea subsp. carminata]|uniref:Signal recognition particle receptor subunit beta n=1 Tax=Nonomuraea roseoviolacea subsp. carminata TaxID=160689 RepID=A0ABT1KBB7_9ACTN|nr:signal recognition particle receptor subunit beta [Nonomuraea roseoviolacea subsp. carminata]